MKFLITIKSTIPLCIICLPTDLFSIPTNNTYITFKQELFFISHYLCVEKRKIKKKKTPLIPRCRGKRVKGWWKIAQDQLRILQSTLLFKDIPTDLRVEILCSQDFNNYERQHTTF